ncbi:MAG: two pore domain potassium channel family protein [Gammaproteobacteria bacterium]|nr:two pore domain potassium channel family protein [Gammaproteobacteria bacterium]MYF52840.1 two pore domain potassium channel family protein [Gammaproteobacteria bacterium]MYK44222.1 two pore domain potassium channel family protein [Gammaproteobacteria bacterium]
MTVLATEINMYYFATFVIAFGTALAAIWIHLSVISLVLSRVKNVLWLTTLILLAHVIEVKLYACVYFVLTHVGGFGEVLNATTGARVEDWGTFTYYSYAVYTTLGFGDLVPVGLIRILTGIESVVGLALIAWTATFTYYRFNEARQINMGQSC